MTTTKDIGWTVEEYTHPEKGIAELCYRFGRNYSHIVVVKLPNNRDEFYREHSRLEDARHYWQLVRIKLQSRGYRRSGEKTLEV